jgi:phage antirepressor YoqD-like protein
MDEWRKYCKCCLTTNGYLLIAETTKALKGRLSNIKDVIEKQDLIFTLLRKKEILHSLRQEKFNITAKITIL